MIRLHRDIPVFIYESEATVAVGRDRPEFLAVARLAADLGRPIGARDVLRELLGGRPEVVGWKVIDRCVALGLLEKGSSGATLSAAGHTALKYGAVLVPEEGLWRFYYVDDPLIPDPLLHVERRYGETAKDERASLKQGRGERPPRAEAPPHLLIGCQGAAVYESVVRESLFQLVRLGEGGQHAKDGTLRLTLEWDVNPKLTLRGALPIDDGELPRVDTQVSVPDVVHGYGRDRTWMALVSHATSVPLADLERWRLAAGKHVLPSRFDEHAETAMRGFARDIPVPRIEFRDLGYFEASTLSAVPLVPATDDDAQRWLEWLQWTSITAYAMPGQLDDEARGLAARFPHHRPRPRSAPELLRRARAERGDRAWNLLAPSDLGLWS